MEIIQEGRELGHQRAKEKVRKEVENMEIGSCEGQGLNLCDTSQVGGLGTFRYQKNIIQNRKVEARLGKLVKIWKAETN